MADIFVSYKKEDAGRVVRIVEGLRKEGFTVWWDHGIAPGSQWDQTIQTELSAARIVVAVWSDLSIHAPWVKEEALTGKARGALVPVRIDDVNPPLGFGLIQFADLIEWDGDIEDKHWDFFIESVRATMGGRPVAGLEKPARKRRLAFGWIAAALGLAVLAGAGALIYSSLGPVSSVSVQRGAGEDATVSTYSRTVTPAQPTDAEQGMWDKISETRLKTDYQDFLRAFPQGFYARQVREEILPLCAGEMRKVWTPNPVPIGQMFRASSQVNPLDSDTILHDTEAAACAQAKANYERDADRYCRTIASSSETRNIDVQINHADCNCQENTGRFFCFVDSNYSCTYEINQETYVEVCG
ncbi:MAG: toll/interleukin-1 receptor domain-containing protein [Pseudomonadota bacterium]